MKKQKRILKYLRKIANLIQNSIIVQIMIKPYYIFIYLIIVLL